MAMACSLHPPSFSPSKLSLVPPLPFLASPIRSHRLSPLVSRTLFPICTLPTPLIVRAQPESKSTVDTDEGDRDERLAVASGTAALLATQPDDAAMAAVAAVLEEPPRDPEDESPREASYVAPELAAIYATCRFWTWRGYQINYTVQGSGPPILLVHGFGASVGHWRRNIKVLAGSSKVFAVDLLGLGASEKPPKFSYTMETWAEMLLDFLIEVVKEPTVVVGNSIGSLACTILATEAPQGLIRGMVLLNCSGGMNNKAITDDWRIKLFLPLLWLIDILLQQPAIASRLFKSVQSRENLRNVLQSIYCNKEAVDDELIEIIRKPAEDAGALDAFVAVITGPPGPSPMSLMPKISIPVLVLWGDKDPFTPINGPVGKYFSGLPAIFPNVELFLLPNVGHCPHDDRPELVHEILLPWLSRLPDN